MAKNFERFTQITEHLKALGHRLTPQRLAILRVLAESRGHPSAEQVYARLRADHPSMSLATVYKTIALLKQAGEVLELQFSDRDNRYDGSRPYPHPHLICTRCGAIMDPEIPGLNDMAARLAEQTGFAVTSHRVDFFGLCPRCRAASTHRGGGKAKDSSSGRS
ncbi:ferric uptake regulator, Fur family [Desulfovibrio sp. X2]|uniref:Fur family transcriptional regulator n=1 Tax=Desulfovibrio sp. X2 TaxID=941449 RepID=UPI0003589E05|nr:transcriptional repressor [Desulfovibrio sp. X2]EPR44531.1 ferric uptake regulator, Fur family [Desulfovibrio sp. X2]